MRLLMMNFQIFLFDMASYGIITISYKRPAVLRLFLAGIKRLRTEVEYFPCVIVGDAEHKSYCTEYDVSHITQDNHPASRKWNTGAEHMIAWGLDYVVVVGSDDILSNELLRNLISAMDKGIDLIGVDTVHFYSAEGKTKGQLRKLTAPKQILGVCRTISRKVIEKTGTLWTRDRSWGMDGDCLRNIMPHVKSKMIVEGMVTDCKTRESLNHFSFWQGRDLASVPPEKFYEYLSTEEKQILKEI